jgi:hypothetical protein
MSSNQAQVLSLASNLRSTTLTSDQHRNNLQHDISSTSKSADSDQSGLKHKSDGAGSLNSNSSSSGSSNNGNNGSFGSTAKYSSQPVYYYTNKNEDLAKGEKFKQILENDPINIGAKLINFTSVLFPFFQ